MSGRVAWRVLVMVAALAGAREANAQARLTGVVRDTTGAPLAGVEVSVQGISRTATTARDGTFQLGGIPAGQSVVTLRRVGYSPQSTIMRFADGDNRLPDAVLTAVARELDTVRTQEQELWRQYPLLREFEEHKKMGLGQFVTRQQLEMHRGGFMTPVLNQMRGVLIVRSATNPSNAWVANMQTPAPGRACTVLEDRMPGERITPTRDADCGYCYPEVYLDRTRLNRLGHAANIGRYHPDMLQAIEVYLGAGETPPSYISGESGCGTIIFHTRVPDIKPRIVANTQDEPTRSKYSASVSMTVGSEGGGCPDCGPGGGADVSAGYTLRDRWVITGRYARWKGDRGGAQTITLKQALVEWYPRPDPGRLKWFINAGLGAMDIDLNSSHLPDYTERFTANGLPSITGATGMDVRLVRRLVLTPFVTYTRQVGGKAKNMRCIDQVQDDGSIRNNCFTVNSVPSTFTLLQLGTRLGWR